MNTNHPGGRDTAADTQDPARAATTADGNPAPEPSTKDQVDIADRVQKDLAKANDRERARENESVEHQAIDGNPAPQPDVEGGMFKPADDTPAVLPEKSGPKE